MIGRADFAGLGIVETTGTPLADEGSLLPTSSCRGRPARPESSLAIRRASRASDDPGPRGRQAPPQQIGHWKAAEVTLRRGGEEPMDKPAGLKLFDFPHQSRSSYHVVCDTQSFEPRARRDILRLIPNQLSQITDNSVRFIPHPWLDMTPVDPTANLRLLSEDADPASLSYVNEYKRRATQRQAVGCYTLSNPIVCGGWQLLTNRWADVVYNLLPGMGWTEQHVERVLSTLSVDKLKFPRHLDGKFILLSYPGGYTFGHWLVDIPTRLFLAREMGFLEGCGVLVPGAVTKWMKGLLDYLDLKENAIVPVGRDDAYTVDELVAPTITGFNGVLRRQLAGPAISQLRGGAKTEQSSSKRDRLLFPLHSTLTSQTHPRQLRDRDRLVHSLEREYSFHVFDPLKLSLPDQIRLFEEAKLIVGEDSSALHNIIWSTDADLVTLCPRGLQNFYHAGIQLIVGGRFGLVEGEQFNDTHLFDIDYKRLFPLIDKSLRG